MDGMVQNCVSFFEVDSRSLAKLFISELSVTVGNLLHLTALGPKIYAAIWD